MITTICVWSEPDFNFSFTACLFMIAGYDLFEFSLPQVILFYPGGKHISSAEELDVHPVLLGLMPGAATHGAGYAALAAGKLPHVEDEEGVLVSSPVSAGRAAPARGRVSKSLAV